jgi:hypothetical protein
VSAASYGELRLSDDKTWMPTAQAPTGECVDILMDFTNCGQIGFDCSFGYKGYYAATPACAMGMCVNLCMNFQTDTYNCGSFGNQCNVRIRRCVKMGCVFSVMNVMVSIQS